MQFKAMMKLKKEFKVLYFSMILGITSRRHKYFNYIMSQNFQSFKINLLITVSLMPFKPIYSEKCQ